ncbi:MAG: DUF47 family protein, partial [Sediminibacterium sp.]|nr:DUF47 family protein [Sediminibacterium sp.]
IDSFFKFFLPKNRIFYSNFESATDCLISMSHTFKELVYETNIENRPLISSKIKDHKHKVNNIIHTIYVELEKNFITPFDREDIYNLAQALNKISSLFYSTSKKIVLYRINPNQLGVIKMADLVTASTFQISIAVKGLQNMKNVDKVMEALVKIKSLEDQMDDAYDMSIEKLYNNQQDVIEVIKMREIYQVLEKLSDKCENVARIIESITIKYA